MDTFPSVSFYENYLLQDAPVLVIDIDDSGIIQKLNSHAKQILGDEALGRSIFDIIVDFGNSLTLESLLQNSLKEKMLDLSTPRGLPETFYFRSIKTREGPRLLGRRHFEDEALYFEQIVDINKDLAVLTRRLSQQNAELDRLNQLKTQFVAMAAHDLRSPTASIQSCSTFLLESLKDALDSEHLAVLEGIVNESESMLKLITSFLNTATIESGHIELKLTKVSIEPTIEQSIDTCLSKARDKNITIEWDNEFKLPFIEMDRGKIKEVITNLLMNSIQHSYAGSSVSVSAHMDGSAVKIVISDQGVGVPEEVKSTLFKAFSSGKTKKTDNESSTGLGLAISKTIVEKHGGEIGLVSEDGVGTSFFFTLPLTQSKIIKNEHS